ncbi:unnamed protein product, partial [Hymenolepis diminuta]
MDLTNAGDHSAHWVCAKETYQQMDCDQSSFENKLINCIFWYSRLSKRSRQSLEANDQKETFKVIKPVFNASQIGETVDTAKANISNEVCSKGSLAPDCRQHRKEESFAQGELKIRNFRYNDSSARKGDVVQCFAVHMKSNTYSTLSVRNFHV